MDTAGLADSADIRRASQPPRCGAVKTAATAEDGGRVGDGEDGEDWETRKTGKMWKTGKMGRRGRGEV
jgi:hypothetical protein